MTGRRILVVCSSHRVFGAETITLRLLEEFKRRGHQQLAVTNLWTDGEFSRRLRALQIDEAVMPFGVLALTLTPHAMWWTANMAIRIPMLWLYWRRVLRRLTPDVILWTSARQPLPLLPLLGDVPSFVIEYTNVPATRGNRWLYRNVARVCRFVAVSDFMRGHLVGVGAPPEAVDVVKSGALFAGDEASTPHATRHRALDEPFRVGIVGQIAAHKGHDLLVDAAAALRRRGLTISVVAYGSGDPAYLDRLNHAIGDAGLADVWEWRGYERDTDVIYRDIDVCVVPSRFGDPFPTVAMEAAAHGIPVVASNIGGLPEIVDDGVTGWLIPAEDAGALVYRLFWLARHPDEARAMGEAGRRRVFTQFTVEAMADGFERLFDERESVRWAGPA
jgi:glycosyltransferase involved in cell wall biosynthesis